MTSVNNNDLVEILVPRTLVMDIYRFIAEKSGSASPPPQRGKGGLNPTELSSEWNAALVKRMYEQSDKNMRAILDYLISHAGEWVKASDLIHVLEQSRDDKKATSNTLGGTLGAFGRRVKSRYKQDSWPFEVIWSPEERQCHYRMSDEVASQLRA